MNGERKEKGGAKVVRVIFSAALAAILAVFVFVVINY